MSDIERGARNPTVRVIWKLADALETQPSVLMGIAEGVLGERRLIGRVINEATAPGLLHAATAATDRRVGISCYGASSTVGSGSASGGCSSSSGPDDSEARLSDGFSTASS